MSSHAYKQARNGSTSTTCQSTRRYRGFAVHSKSKLANISFTARLARRLDGSGVAVNALHPGIRRRRFGRDGDTGRLGDIAMVLIRPFAINAEQGAETSISSRPRRDPDGITGEYCTSARWPLRRGAAQEDDAARRLWSASVGARRGGGGR